MARRQPITKRFPNRWVFKGKVWTPTRGSLAYEGELPDEIGEVIMTLLAVAFARKKLLTEGFRKLLKKLVKSMGKEIAKTEEPAKAQSKSAMMSKASRSD